MEEWRQQLKNIVNGFAKLHNIPVKDLETIRLED
jgi:hypothetical protein